MDTQTLMELRSHLTLAHHVPGRMRIKFRPAIATAPALQKTMDWWREQGRNNEADHKWLINYRLNVGSLSLIVEYDRRAIDYELLDELFSTQDKQRMNELINKLAESFGLKPSR